MACLLCPSSDCDWKRCYNDPDATPRHSNLSMLCELATHVETEHRVDRSLRRIILERLAKSLEMVLPSLHCSDSVQAMADGRLEPSP